MTPQRALDRLRGFCEDRQQRYQHRGTSLRDPGPFLTTAEILGVLDDVDPEPAGLYITETEASWILGRWTPEKADLAARALAEHAHQERAPTRNAPPAGKTPRPRPSTSPTRSTTPPDDHPRGATMRPNRIPGPNATGAIRRSAYRLDKEKGPDGVGSADRAAQTPVPEGSMPHSSCPNRATSGTRAA